MNASKALSDALVEFVYTVLQSKLRHLHNLQWVHMDIKPENLACMDEPAKDASLYRFADFGLCVWLNRNATIDALWTEAFDAETFLP